MKGNPYYKCPCCGVQSRAGVVIRHWFSGGYDARCEKCGASSPTEIGQRARSSSAAVKKMVANDPLDELTALSQEIGLYD